MSRGRIFVIEGTDGTGKGTQTKLLTDFLQEQGHPIETVDFPRYGQPSAFMLEGFLNGDFGSIKDVSPHAASIFFAIDRFAAANQIREMLDDGKIIIANRYSSSNLGHQAGKIRDLKERAIFLDWLHELEHTHLKIPQPSNVFLLYLDPAEAQKRVDKKEARAYTRGKKRDIHEADLDHLKHAAEAYLWTAKRYGWEVVDASGTKADVHSRLADRVLAALN